MRSCIRLDCNVRIEVKDAVTHDLILSQEVHNLVVRGGLTYIASLLAGDVSDSVGYMAVGTGSVDVAALNTSLGTEVHRGQMTQTTVEDALVTFEYYLPSTSANGYTLSEAGLWTAASGGTMIARMTHLPYDKSSSVVTTYSWDINLTAG